MTTVGMMKRGRQQCNGMEGGLTQQSKNGGGIRTYGKRRGMAVVIGLGREKIFISNKIISFILSIHHTTIKHIKQCKIGGKH
jgi:hypothetical protein